MTRDALENAAATHGLFIMGELDDAGDTLILLGAGPGMWPAFKASPEFRDGAPDPLDRWSKRIIGSLSEAYNGRAVYPSDGPPYAPFIAWALATGRFWQSPTGMLVHDTAGLMISIRGAIRLAGAAAQKADHQSPCESCADRPCIPACPVGALSAHASYDVPACKAHIRTQEGRDCQTAGCLVRRACPISQRFGRDPEQSAFHMTAFIGA